VSTSGSPSDCLPTGPPVIEPSPGPCFSDCLQGSDSHFIIPDLNVRISTPSSQVEEFPLDGQNSADVPQPSQGGSQGVDVEIEKTILVGELLGFDMSNHRNSIREAILGDRGFVTSQ
jgi:hypothetical protein